MRCASICSILLMVSVQSANALPQTVSSALSNVSFHCAGFHVLSEYRPRATVAGTHRASLHRYDLAVDFRVNNYSCAYSVLAGWTHGLSVDASRVRHIHISDGSSIGKNEGRFRHGGSSHHRYHHRRHV